MLILTTAGCRFYRRQEKISTFELPMKQFGISFGLIGLGFLIAASWLFLDHQQFMSRSKEAVGEITEIKLVEGKGDDGDYYVPVISYLTAEGKMVTAHLNTTQSPVVKKDHLHVGRKISIRYDPKNPQKIFLMGFFDNWGLIFILGGIGVILFISGFLSFYFQIRRIRIIKWLQTNGEKIEADFDSIQIDYSTTKNEIHPFTIMSSWVDKKINTKYIFITKEDIWEDPTPYIPANKKIPVLIDSHRPPKRYWIDTGFLPQKNN